MTRTLLSLTLIIILNIGCIAHATQITQGLEGLRKKLIELQQKLSELNIKLTDLENKIKTLNLTPKEIPKMTLQTLLKACYEKDIEKVQAHIEAKIDINASANNGNGEIVYPLAGLCLSS